MNSLYKLAPAFIITASLSLFTGCQPEAPVPPPNVSTSTTVEPVETESNVTAADAAADSNVTGADETP